MGVGPTYSDLGVLSYGCVLSHTRQLVISWTLCTVFKTEPQTLVKCATGPWVSGPWVCLGSFMYQVVLIHRYLEALFPHAVSEPIPNNINLNTIGYSDSYIYFTGTRRRCSHTPCRSPYPTTSTPSSGASTTSGLSSSRISGSVRRLCCFLQVSWFLLEDQSVFSHRFLRAIPENRDMNKINCSFFHQRHALLTSFDIFVVTYRVTNALPKLLDILLFSMVKTEFQFFFNSLFWGFA